MIRRRLVAVLLQLLIATPAAIGTGLTAPAAQPARAAGECQVDTGVDGGLLSTCPDADTFDEFSAGISGGLDAARSENATGSLSVTSEPAGAEVTLDGLPVGVTPVDRAVPVGSHLVRLSLAGYAPYSTTAMVAKGGPTPVAATLVPMGGDVGSFEWVRAASLIGQAGGYPNGGFEITHFLRDRDGAWWIAFINEETQWFESEEPDGAPFYTGIQTKAQHDLRVSGVARSTDAGSTWSVVQSWHDSFSVRGKTSREFKDSQWDPVANGFPESFKNHVLKAYYTERFVEEYIVTDLVPRADGGVSIVLWANRSHIPQELEGVWDNAGSQNFPGEFMGDTVTKLADDPTYESVTSDEAQDRWGMSREDLATYWWQDAEYGQKIVNADGTEFPIAVSGLPDPHTDVDYQGSHDGVDYFLSYDYTGSDIGPHGYVLASRDGGRTMTVDTFYAIPAATKGRFPYEDLRIGPDGTKYLVEHLAVAGAEAQSAVFELGPGGQTRELGSTPKGMVVGVAGGNNLPFLALAFDSAGNLHGAYRASITADDNRKINVYYQLFPKDRVQYDGVALLTQPDCAACEAAATFLTEAGVAFQKDPTNLPADLAATAAAQASSAGYPVLVRLGEEPVAVGAASIPTISRLLGISHPTLVETYDPRFSARVIEPQWLALFVEDDQPRIVADHRSGVVVLSPAAGGWTQAPLLSAPPQIADPSGVVLSRRYPWLPSSAGTGGFLSAQHDVPFNTIEKAADFAYLHPSAGAYSTDSAGEQHAQYDYTLWTTAAAGESSEFRAVTEVSQLIPAGVFWIALGEKGTAAKVAGELAGYVTDEQEVTDDGGRFYRVTVDLRKRHETATDGNIRGRTIGGAVEVQTTTEDGQPDTRQVNLVLLVQNTRLRAFDPDSRAFAADITTEAVHFIGLDEHWQIVNNIGLENSLPCGPDQWLVLDPFSVATFTRNDVDQWDIGSCLAAAEVAPTVLASCDSWADAKLLLATETLAALSMSLPITRSEGVTNWELAYGNRDATIHRVVSLDPPTGGGPACAGEASGARAAVVRIRGPFIGGGEPYQPAIDIVDKGTVEVQTASLARPGDLAWERGWLEFESAFLEANIGLSIGREAIGTWLFLGGLAKKTEYVRHLLAVRALLHCNHLGVDVGSINRLLVSTAGVPGALRDSARCLQDFVLNPTTYWSTYDPRIWASGSQEADWTGDVMAKALVGNVTLAFLVAADKGLALDYGLFVINAAQQFEGKDNAVSVDYELDHYARLATAAASELNGVDGGLLKLFLLSGPLERTTAGAVIDCLRTAGTATSLSKMIETTSKREFAGGIPCVDSRPSQTAKLERYQQLAIGLRGGTFGALLEAAGRDLDLLDAYIDRYLRAVDVGTALERQYPGAAIDAWRWDRPAAERMLLAVREMQSIAERRGRQPTVGEIDDLLRGTSDCVMGLVASLISGDSLWMMAAGAAATIAGPTAAVVGGTIFVAFGVVTTAVGAYDLAQAWETLDLAAKTSGICGVAASAVMTYAGARGVGHLQRTIEAAHLADLEMAQLLTIDAETLPSRGRSAGLTLEEQAKASSARDGSIAPVPEAPPPVVDPGLELLLTRLPENERAAAMEVANRLGYEHMTVVEQDVVRELLIKRESTLPGQSRADHRYAMQLQYELQGLKDSAEWRAWDGVGEAVLEVLGGSEPKSLARRVVPGRAATSTTPAEPAHVIGSDAEILKAADDANTTPALVGTANLNVLKSRQPRLLQAILGSQRVLDALNATNVRALFTAAQAEELYVKVNQVRPDIDSSFFRELASPRFVEALRAAAVEAQGTVRSQEITGIAVEALDPGQSKIAFRMTLRLADGKSVDFVVAKGDITSSEAAIYAQYGTKGVTQRLLSPLLKDVDGTQAMMLTEWWPGRKVTSGIAGFKELYDATADPGYAKAIGGLVARIWSETRDSSGQAIFDGDLHGRNFNVRDGGGLDAARAIDFGGQFSRRTGQSVYWTAEILRRVQEPQYSFSVKNMGAFLDGVFEQLSKDPKVGRSNALALLRDLSLDLLDPDVLAEARQIQLGIDDAAVASRASSILDGWLAKQFQGGVVIPFPGLQSASSAGLLLAA